MKSPIFYGPFTSSCTIYRWHFEACVCTCVRVCGLACGYRLWNATEDNTNWKIDTVYFYPFQKKNKRSQYKTKDIDLLNNFLFIKNSLFSCLFGFWCAFEHQEINSSIFYLTIEAIKTTLGFRKYFTLPMVYCYLIIYVTTFWIF